MTEPDNREIKEYFKYFSQNFPNRDTLDLLLFFIGARPACLLINASEEEICELKQFCGKYKFYYKVEQTRSTLTEEAVFISREEKRLKMLEKNDGRFCGFSDNKVGQFLDFPAKDTEYFQANISNGQIEPEAREKAENMISEGKIDKQDLKHIEIAPYVPKPDSKSIKKCIEKGRDYEQEIREFDKSKETDLGSKILQDFLQNH